MNGMVRGCGLWLVALSVGAGGAWAQGRVQADESADRAVKPLAAKQEMIRDRLRRLQDRMFRLRETLAETEPETATKLAKALERIGQVGVEEKVRLLIEMLADEARVSRAGEVQAALAEDLEGVLAVLLARRDRDARQRRTERLQQSRRAVREVLEQQRALRAETAEALGRRERDRQIGDALKRLEKLIGRQKGLRTDAADEGGSAEAQRNLSGDAQALAEDVRAIEDGTEEGDPGDPNPSGAEEQPESGQAGGATAEAAEAIEQASRAMERAAEGLAGGDADDTETEQERAQEQLERARHRLEEAQESAARERAAAPDKTAGKQQAAADRARAIAKQMGGESEGSDRGRPGGERQPGGNQQPGGDPNDSQQGRQEPMPGQHNVEEAGRQMDDAAEDLNRDQPEQAIPNQDRAAEELEEALGKLEDELQQLRREERLELLGDLESRFAEMLHRQVSINEATVAIERRRGESLDRSDRLALAELSERQGALADRAATCLHILEEDGTTVVFPRIVEQVGRDMRTVADRLTQRRSGALTQTMQAGIVSALGELVEAVRRKQESQEQQQGQPQGQGAPQSDEAPLLPGSAELKLLKVAQLRINERTAAVETARRSGAESDESLGRVLEGLLVRQRSLAEAARDMRDQTE